MRVIGVIPSRFGSTRFPGKPLEKINGKPLLQWVVEGTKSSQRIDEIIVATDHNQIFDLALELGVKAVMTDPKLPSGSDRVWEAIKLESTDIVLNIQGDEPLISGEVLDQLVNVFDDNQNLQMATLAREITEEDLLSNATAKIVCNEKSEAIYFSRFPIPYSKGKTQKLLRGALKHIGIYAYTKDFLRKFCSQAPVLIEELEGLEQLRALYLGASIKIVKVDHDSWGVDYPEDIQKIEGLIKKIIK